ncbi:MAG: ATP-binding cassette domain-containing protein, partial [Eggerthellaceae bacterium]|nr:ATP-binding cassette domain-containing protein [Eggerthellaceae bacterium]
GFVFQSFNLLPRASVLRNVMLPLVYSSSCPKSKRLERAFRSLVLAGLPESYYDHAANELSGGQMQRVAIARALVNDPALVLADEPTGNLDSVTSEKVLTTFRRLSDSGKTVVLITHDPEVSQWADRTVHIRDGILLSDEEERAVVAASAAARSAYEN